MTCIVGLVERDPKLGRRVWMGADSVASTGHDLQLVAPKVFETHYFLIGYTTSFRMGQILQFRELPELPPTAHLYPFMVTEFVPAVVKLFEADGYLKKEHDQKSGGQFLVGVRGELFQINSDFSVLQRVDFDFNAVGSGEGYALGALHAIRNTDNPKRKILAALDAAQSLGVYARKPYTILKGRWHK